MAIPIGTTARQIEAVGRWTLAGAIALGMLTWWWPGFRTWGAAIAALGLAWMLWLVWRTSTGERGVPGHPIHVALLGPAAVLGGHVIAANIAGGRTAGLAGAMNLSMLLQIAVLALGVMLSQDFLTRAASRPTVPAVCGAAMIGGGILGMFLSPGGSLRDALGILALAGAAGWLATIWARTPIDDAGAEDRPISRRWLVAGQIAVAAAAVVIVFVSSPLATAAGLAVPGVLLLAGGVAWRGGRTWKLAWGAVCLGLAVVVSLIARIGVSAPPGGVTLFGRGEQGFADVSASDGGGTVLLATVGGLGVVWLAAGLAATLAVMLAAAGRGGAARRGRAIAWSAAAGLSVCAMAAPGGLFSPAITLGVLFTWGLLPAMVGRKRRRRSGWFPAAGAVVLLALLGLAPDQGLAAWTSAALGGSDKFLHASAGFFLSLTLAWLLGVRRWWAGLAAIAVAVAVGAAAEIAQGYVPGRSRDISDFEYHVVGCVLAAVPYLLALGARWCESPEATVNESAWEAYRR